jgi:AraC-like DNA-binding protein
MLNVLNSLCMASELAGHKAEQTKWMQQLLDLAKQTDNAYYESLGLLAMGKRIYYEGDRQQGIQYVSEAIDLMAKTDREDADHLTHSQMIILAGLYSDMNDLDNALRTDERNVRLTMEGTRWGNTPQLQLIDRRMALAKTAYCLAKMGNFQRADSAYAAWKAVQYEGNHTRDYFIVDYMRRRGRYAEAVTIYNGLIERVRQQGDTLGEMMNTAKWGLADVYHQMGNCEQAAALYEQVLEIQDTLKSRKARSNAQELAAIYHDKEQQQTIMQQQAENTRQEAIILIIVLVLIGMTALAAVVLRKNRIIHRKNQSLTQQITEAMIYKERYMQQMAESTRSADKPTDPDKLTDEQLFQYINDVIVRERLFVAPNFDRQQIMDRFQLTKERVGAAFSKGSQYAKLTDYTQELRLEYSTLLMSSRPDLSISQIAIDCGFSSYAYYGKCFRHRFGMTPTEFRTSAEQHKILSSEY